MDFTNLHGISIDMRLSPDKKYLRRFVYLMFANTCNLERLYTDVLARFQKYISTNLLLQNYDKDILYSFFNGNEYASTMKEHEKINLNVEVHSRPLLPAIKIAPSLKVSHQILTKINKIGYQHLYILYTTTDTSDLSSSNTSDSDSDSDSNDDRLLRIKLNGFHIALEFLCQKMMVPRIKNATNITGSTVHVDILIFMDKTFCKQLSDYLGLIHADVVVEEIGEKDIDDVLLRLNKKSGKLYRLIQSYINKHLINGYNNICLVNHLSLWEKFNANVRAVISTKDSNIDCMEAVKTSNFHVKLGENTSILHYLESISVIIDQALNFKSHVVAKYKCGKNCYHNVKLPLISIIPLYILRYLRLCRILEQDAELD